MSTHVAIFCLISQTAAKWSSYWKNCIACINRHKETWTWAAIIVLSSIVAAFLRRSSYIRKLHRGSPCQGRGSVCICLAMAINHAFWLYPKSRSILEWQLCTKTIYGILSRVQFNFKSFFFWISDMFRNTRIDILVDIIRAISISLHDIGCCTYNKYNGYLLCFM
jgi:hypothetical protein